MPGDEIKSSQRCDEKFNKFGRAYNALEERVHAMEELHKGVRHTLSAIEQSVWDLQKYDRCNMVKRSRDWDSQPKSVKNKPEDAPSRPNSASRLAELSNAFLASLLLKRLQNGDMLRRSLTEELVLVLGPNTIATPSTEGRHLLETIAGNVDAAMIQGQRSEDLCETNSENGPGTPPAGQIRSAFEDTSRARDDGQGGLDLNTCEIEASRSGTSENGGCEAQSGSAAVIEGNDASIAAGNEEQDVRSEAAVGNQDKEVETSQPIASRGKKRRVSSHDPPRRTSRKVRPAEQWQDIIPWTKAEDLMRANR